MAKDCKGCKLTNYQKAIKKYKENDIKYQLNAKIGNEIAELIKIISKQLNAYSAYTDKTTDILFKMAHNSYKKAMKIKRQDLKK